MALSISAIGIQKVNYPLIQILLTNGVVFFVDNFHLIPQGHRFGRRACAFLAQDKIPIFPGPYPPFISIFFLLCLRLS